MERINLSTILALVALVIFVFVVVGAPAFGDPTKALASGGILLASAVLV